MNSIKEQQTITLRRRQSTADALASVRAEGLQPSASVIKRLGLYTEGKITASQLHQETLADIKARNKPVKVL